MLDNTIYITVEAVRDFVADTPINLIHLPTASPDMDLVEVCWRQFKTLLGTRFFDELADLKQTL